MGRSACASSVLNLMMLAATRGAEIEITADGEDAREAAEQIAAILRNPAMPRDASAESDTCR
jgi:phosphotransferase system HPr (HPr) family protein